MNNNFSLSNKKNGIPIKDVHLIFDLNGVLINKPVMSKKYDISILEFLHEKFSITKSTLKKTILNANNKWNICIKELLPLSGDQLLMNYEEANTIWIKDCLYNYPFFDYHQLGEFLEYYIPTKICGLYPEVRSTLTELKKMGVHFSLASSAHTRHIYGTLIGCTLLHLFDNIIGFNSVKFFKTNIKYFQQTLQIINKQPEKCVFIGDSLEEIKHPKELGCKVIHIIRNQNTSGLSNYPYQADLYLSNLKNLFKKMLNVGILT